MCLNEILCTNYGHTYCLDKQSVLRPKEKLICLQKSRSEELSTRYTKPEKKDPIAFLQSKIFQSDNFFFSDTDGCFFRLHLSTNPSFCVIYSMEFVMSDL